MYHVDTEDVGIWCNGRLRWVYLKADREVSLYSAGNDDLDGPLQLIGNYTGDHFVAAVTATRQDDGKVISDVELKPVDRGSPVAKVRLSLTGDGLPVEVFILEKSGTRTVMHIKDILVPARQTEAYFTFDPDHYPGVHVEDLRID
jgi:hypothetical protein